MTLRFWFSQTFRKVHGVFTFKQILNFFNLRDLQPHRHLSLVWAVPSKIWFLEALCYFRLYFCVNYFRQGLSKFHVSRLDLIHNQTAQCHNYSFQRVLYRSDQLLPSDRNQKEILLGFKLGKDSMRTILNYFILKLDKFSGTVLYSIVFAVIQNHRKVYQRQNLWLVVIWLKVWYCSTQSVFDRRTTQICMDLLTIDEWYRHFTTILRAQ